MALEVYAARVGRTARQPPKIAPAAALSETALAVELHPLSRAQRLATIKALATVAPLVADDIVAPRCEELRQQVNRGALTPAQIRAELADIIATIEGTPPCL